MGRVIAVGPGGRAQAPKRDTRYAGVVSKALAAYGLDRVILSPPCSGAAQADDVRRGIYRSCGHYCSCGGVMCTRKNREQCPRGGQRISTRATIVRDEEDRLRVQFCLWDKQAARRSHIARHGTDRSKWPYDPKARKRR
jgi:hypothetical protein